MKRTAVGRNPVRINRPILQNKHDGIKFRSGGRSDKHIALRLPNRRFDPGSSNASPTKRGYLDRENLPPTTELPIRTRKNIPCEKRKAIIPVRILFVQGLSFPAPTAAPHGSGPPSHRLDKIREQKSRKPPHELFPIQAKHISEKNRMENIFHPVFFRIVRPGTRPSGQKARIGRATAS